MNEQWIKLIETVISQGGDAALKMVVILQVMSLIKTLVIAVGVPLMIFKGATALVKVVKE